MKVRISLNGCDDITAMERDVSEDEWEFLTSLARQSEDEGGGCQPTMHVDRTSEDRAKVYFVTIGWSFNVLCEHGDSAGLDLPFNVRHGHQSREAAEDAARANGYEVQS